MNLWQLPRQAVFGNARYPFNADYRDILEIIGYLGNGQLPQSFRWEIAIGLFYKRTVAQKHRAEAVAYLRRFLTRGREETPGPALIHWEQDADAIVADINRISGREIRGERFIHWWTFLSWIDSIGQGQLSQIVSLRQKLRRGEALTPQEREFYRQNQNRVRPRDEDPQKQRLEAMLAGQGKEDGYGHPKTERTASFGDPHRQ